MGNPTFAQGNGPANPPEKLSKVDGDMETARKIEGDGIPRAQDSTRVFYPL